MPTWLLGLLLFCLSIIITRVMVHFIATPGTDPVQLWHTMPLQFRIVTIVNYLLLVSGAGMFIGGLVVQFRKKPSH